MLGYLVMMMAQILQYGLTFIFDFSTYLTEQIHHCLIRIAKGELDKPFYWYSILMYICLYKGSVVLGRDMKLVKESDGVAMLIQLWNADITSEASGASYVHFDKFFASKLRGLLVQNNLRIPLLLLQLIRPKEYPTGLLVSHN